MAQLAERKGRCKEKRHVKATSAPMPFSLRLQGRHAAYAYVIKPNQRYRLMEDRINSKYPDFLCYYFRNTPTFQSILEMGIDSAKEFLRKNDRDWRSEDDYLHFRLEVESWVKSQFKEKGGKPKLIYPIYMFLGFELIIETDADYKGKLIIPLDIFSREDISFTYLDSMHTNEGKQPVVFMMDEIERMIDIYGSGNTEAQIWNTKPLDQKKKSF